METLLPGIEAREEPSSPQRALRWIAWRGLSPGFWTFFGAAFFFDAGFAVYYFLFNLYLVDLRFHEQAIGLINGAATLGSVLVTLPAGMLARRYGVRPVMLCCFVAAPLTAVLRALFVQHTAQLLLAFAGGAALGLWGICFLPGVTRLTIEENRAAAFSLIFSVSIGTGALGSLLCGYLPGWLLFLGVHAEPLVQKRWILIGAAGCAMLGLPFVLRLRIPHNGEGARDAPQQVVRRVFGSVFLRTMLPLMAVWSGLIASLTAFAAVYFARKLSMPLERIGFVFSLSQVIQLCAGLLTVPIFRVAGLQRGVAATQVAVAALLFALASVHNAGSAAVFYLVLTAAQWMSSPGLYNMLMTGCPDRERSSVASFAMFLNAAVSSAATALAGVAIARYGYDMLFGVLALVALGIGSWTALSRLPREVAEAT